MSKVSYKSAYKPRHRIRTLEDVHRCVANVVSDLKSISQSLDLREPFLEILRSLLNRLLLRLHQVEGVATLAADRGLQGRDGILEERVAHVANTRWIVVVRVIIGKCTPLRSRVNDFVSNLCGCWSVSVCCPAGEPTYNESTGCAHHVAAAELLGQVWRKLLAVRAYHDMRHLVILLVFIVGSPVNHRGRRHGVGAEGD